MVRAYSPQVKRAVVFLHGNKPSKDLIQKNIYSNDFIICADGGAEYAIEFDLKPNVIIGDQDSLPNSLKQQIQTASIKLITFPTGKNETDSELAIQYALGNGFKHIVVFGAYGDRIDHFLSNILMLAKLSDSVEFKIIQDHQDLYFVRKELKIQGVIGDYISLIPLITDVSGITTKGLKFPLTNASLFLGKTRGVSNELIKNECTISLESGILLVIHTKI